MPNTRKDESTNTMERAVSTADNAMKKIELLLSQENNIITILLHYWARPG